MEKSASIDVAVERLVTVPELAEDFLNGSKGGVVTRQDLADTISLRILDEELSVLRVADDDRREKSGQLGTVTVGRDELLNEEEAAWQVVYLVHQYYRILAQMIENAKTAAAGS